MKLFWYRLQLGDAPDAPFTYARNGVDLDHEIRWMVKNHHVEATEIKVTVQLQPEKPEPKPGKNSG